MSKNNKEYNKERLKDIINLDREKIKHTTENNEKEINILEGCEKFCDKYKNENFTTYDIEKIREICDEGNELLDNYFIFGKFEIIDSPIIAQLQHIITNAICTLNIKQMENSREEAVKINTELNNNIKEKAKEIKEIKDDVKSIITTVLAIVLAFSIIPTALEAVDKIDVNYVMPFILSIIVFAMFMTMFIYTIYQNKIKWISWAIFIISIIICVLLWVNTIYGFIKIDKEQNLIVNNVENIEN